MAFRIKVDEVTLTDRSKVFDVVLIRAGNEQYGPQFCARFLCENEPSANHFAEQLAELINTHTCEDASCF